MPKKSENKKTASKGVVSELYFWAQALVFALVILVCINVFFFRISGVDGSSMYPTLKNRDQIIMRVIGYDTPERGDIVVITAPSFENEPLVKRVIAVGGDVIDIDQTTGNVTVNGEVQYEPYINEPTMSAGDMQYPYTVPEGHVFVMGDNRNHSSDSRVSYIGALPYENIIGKVVFRIWPITSIGGLS